MLVFGFYVIIMHKLKSPLIMMFAICTCLINIFHMYIFSMLISLWSVQSLSSRSSHLRPAMSRRLHSLNCRRDNPGRMIWSPPIITRMMAMCRRSTTQVCNLPPVLKIKYSYCKVSNRTAWRVGCMVWGGCNGLKHKNGRNSAKSGPIFDL